MNNDSTPAIEVQNLTKRFGSLTAVDDITFSVKKRSIFGFLGPNGAGKTTTINILCTLLKATEGRALINGMDCAKDPAGVRRSIGIVFQDTTLDKDLTARENLTFHAYLYKVPKPEVAPRVDDALRFVNLYERKDDIVKRFSGGMKRRLEVARGLIHRPAVLFLDEPTLGLDPQSRQNLWEYITKMPELHDVTIFMTTHYMEEAEVCQNIAVIDGGKIISSGSPEELKKLVGGDVISLRTRDNTLSSAEIRRLFGLEAVEKNGELYITSPQGDACIPELIKGLGDSVLSVKLQRPTLNDVFLKLTGKTIRETEGSSSSTIKDEIRAYRRRKS